MRKIVVELYGRGLRRAIGASVSMRRLRAFEVLQILRYDRNGFAAICRITPRNPRTRVEDVFRDDPGTSEIQVLDRGPRASIALVKRRPLVGRPGPPGPAVFGGEVTRPGAGYLLGPLGFRDGRLRFTFVGDQQQLREILGRADARRLKFRIVSLTEASFASSPLDRLTDAQRSVLLAAYRRGYYDVPRRITSRGLARAVGRQAGTVAEHLRKAEKRLLDALLLS